VCVCVCVIREAHSRVFVRFSSRRWNVTRKKKKKSIGSVIYIFTLHLDFLFFNFFSPTPSLVPILVWIFAYLSLLSHEIVIRYLDGGIPPLLSFFFPSFFMY